MNKSLYLLFYYVDLKYFLNDEKVSEMINIWQLVEYLNLEIM